MPRFLLLCSACALLLTACDGADVKHEYPDAVRPRPGPDGTSSYYPSEQDQETLLGRGGLRLFGGDEDESSSGGGIGVNAYLWRASLDALSFMPLASADPFGGVIITDWFAPPETPGERLKVNVFILGRQLRSNGLRVSVFRQTRDDAAQWIDAEVDRQTVVEVENRILARARELRVRGL